ncbi:hypothetical protein [Luteococcus sediminum]
MSWHLATTEPGPCPGLVLLAASKAICGLALLRRRAAPWLPWVLAALAMAGFWLMLLRHGSSDPVGGPGLLERLADGAGHGHPAPPAVHRPRGRSGCGRLPAAEPDGPPGRLALGNRPGLDRPTDPAGNPLRRRAAADRRPTRQGEPLARAGPGDGNADARTEPAPGETSRLLHDHVLHALHGLGRQSSSSTPAATVEDCRVAVAGLSARRSQQLLWWLEDVLAPGLRVTVEGGASTPLPHPVAAALAEAVHRITRSLARRRPATQPTVVVLPRDGGVRVVVDSPRSQTAHLVQAGSPAQEVLDEVGGALAHDGTGLVPEWPRRHSSPRHRLACQPGRPHPPGPAARRRAGLLTALSTAVLAGTHLDETRSPCRWACCAPRSASTARCGWCRGRSAGCWWPSWCSCPWSPGVGTWLWPPQTPMSPTTCGSPGWSPA